MNSFKGKSTEHGGLCNKLLFATFAAIFVSACSSSSDSDPVDGGNGEASGFHVSGEVAGLSDGEIVVELNGDEVLELDQDGTFQFDASLEDGDDYEVVLIEGTESHLCQLDNASGEIAGASVDDVAIDCSDWGLKAFNEREAIEIVWEPEDGVDILYSTDPDCAWENVNQCDHGGVIAQSDGQVTLSVEQDSLPLNETVFIVATYDNQASRMISATPSQFVVRGYVNDVAMTDDRVVVGSYPASHGVPQFGLIQFSKHEGNYRHSGAVWAFERGGTASPSVNSAVQAPDGGWYVSGMFSHMDGFPQSNLVRVKPNGQVDTSWEVDVSGVWVSIEAVDEDRIYLTGRFRVTEDGEEYPSLVALNHDGSVDTNFQPEAPFEPGGLVRPEALLLHEDRIYMSGFFSRDANENEENIAALDRETGALIESFDVELEDGSLDPNFSPDFSGNVNAMLMHDGNLLVGGDFDQVNGLDAPNLVAIDPESGSVDSSWDIHADSWVASLDQIDGHIYVSGGFDVLGEIHNPNPARIDISSAAAQVDESWHLPVHGSTQGVITTDDGYFAFGHLTGVVAQELGGLYALSLEDGQPLDDWSPDVQGAVYSVLNTGSTIYAGGSFESVAGEDHLYAAAFDPNDGSHLSWDPAPDGMVVDLEYSQYGVYLTGEFSQVQGEDRDSLALVDSVSGSPMATDPLTIDGDVLALFHMESYDVLFIGGSFDSVNSGYPYISARNDMDLSSINWDPGLNDTVHAVGKIDPDHILVGGEFTTVDGDSRSGFAVISESGGIQGAPPTVDGMVRSINFDEDSQLLTIGGSFEESDGVDSLDGFAAFTFDESDGSYTLKDNLPVFNDYVEAMDQVGSYIAVGGLFDRANGIVSGPVVLLDSETMEVIWPEQP